MKTKKIVATLIIVIAIISLIIYSNFNKREKQDKDKIKILTSFYPIYIMTLNITKGANNVEVSNMAEKLTGCIHDYTLTTTDLRKFEDADIFIQNGAGLERFTDKITSSYGNVKIISAAENVTNFIYSDDGESNSHIWLSIDNYKNEVQEIANELSKIDSKNADTYLENCNSYLQKLDELQEKFKQLNLQNQKAICLNESLEYLLRENNIDETLVETDHEQASISAKMVKDIISKMNEENIDAIFIDKNDSDKLALVLQNETDAKIYVLDSGMNGKEDLNSYIETMTKNYEILKELEK